MKMWLSNEITKNHYEIVDSKVKAERLVVVLIKMKISKKIYIPS